MWWLIAALVLWLVLAVLGWAVIAGGSILNDKEK